MDPQTFKRQLKEILEDALVGKRRVGGAGHQSAWVESVELQEGYPDTRVALILRDDAQPGCRFVWGGAIGDFEPNLPIHPEPDPKETAYWIELKLDEEIGSERHGLPIRCLPGTRTPVGPAPMLLLEAAQRAPFPVLAPHRPPLANEPEVQYEERRRFYPFASVKLILPCTKGLVVQCQTERLREEVPEKGWERLERDVEGETWPLILREYQEGDHFKISPLTKVARTVGLNYEDFVIFIQTDALSTEELLDIACSLRPVEQGDA